MNQHVSSIMQLSAATTIVVLKMMKELEALFSSGNASNSRQTIFSEETREATRRV